MERTPDSADGRPRRIVARRHVLSLCIASALVVAIALPLSGGCKGSGVFDVAFIASSQDFAEGTEPTVTLDVIHVGGDVTSYLWSQIGGFTIPMTINGPYQAVLDFSNVRVAVDTEFSFRIMLVTDFDGGRTATKDITILVRATSLDNALGEYVQIGGASIAAATFEHGGSKWVLFNNGNRLNATTVGTTVQGVYSLYAPGLIRDIDIIDFNGARYALLAMGAVGIGVVDITDPTTLQMITSVRVNYSQSGITFTDGGGTIAVDQTIASTRAPITALLTDGTTLWIADEGYGLHRTALDNLLVGPVLEADGTLQIDSERFTLQYAGERPWGGPQSLRMHGGKLFVALAFLGLGIFDPDTLEQVGRYNLYTDTDVHEDWFLNMDVTTLVQSDGSDLFLDDFTGMPDYRQVSFEIQQVWHAGVNAPTPWADFDREGKYYYRSSDVEVADHGGRTIAYIAYGLAGLIAVNVTGYQAASSTNMLTATYLGYAPPVPAHGPEEPRMGDTRSLFPYHGAGRLKEAGVTKVAVDGNEVYFADHFAGLVVLRNAPTPEAWKGSSAPYHNDTNNVAGDHIPSIEWVTSYDMSPSDPTDEESLPVWITEASGPCQLATGEVAGHGNTVLLVAPLNTSGAGNVDVIQCAGGGGLVFFDIVDFTAPLMTDRFTAPVAFATTNEIGALPDGTAGQAISIGHAQGAAVSGRYLYIGDGPHGVSAWIIANADGSVLDVPRLVANTVQDEYPVDAGGTLVYPATHASRVVYSAQLKAAFACCQSVGLRRLDVTAVEAGSALPGSPLLLQPRLTDIFEHKGSEEEEEEGGGGGLPAGLRKQDHAYDVAIKGNLAFVADGPNGLTIYDLSRDPSDRDSGFVVGNVGGASGVDPALGRATGVALWSDPQTKKDYAFVAGGPDGCAVVDVTHPAAPVLIKIFQPIKIEQEEEEIHISAADGKSVDVHVVGEHVYYSYSSFGIVAYRIADMLAPLPPGIDPTEIWVMNQYDFRPAAVGYFKLTLVPGYEEESGEALWMEPVQVAGKLTFVVAYGASGVVRIDWTNVASPQLTAQIPTVAEATSVAVANGRIYVADYDGGIAVLR